MFGVDTSLSGTFIKAVLVSLVIAATLAAFIAPVTGIFLALMLILVV